jgi:hypothetical protein
MSRNYTCHASLLAFALATAACGGGGYNAPVSVPKAPSVQHLAEAVVNSAFIVGPRTFKPFKVTLMPGMTNARLEGSFTASGANDDIEVTLLDEALFANWQNRSKFEAAYESGRVTSGKIAVTLPARPGTYYVVFSNRFSLISNKAVTADLQLRYDKS